jgi:lysophospholipase L1-like esterase
MLSKGIVVRLLLLSLGVAIPCLLLEVLSRILPLDWSEERARFYQYDPELGWRGKANASGTFRTIDFSTWVQLNSHGLRASEIPYEKGVQERRILVLGDSFVWGYGVNADQRFTERLHEGLAKSTVINAGCSGYGTDQELLFYRSEGKRYSADVVIVALHLRSDLKNNISSRQYGSHKPVAWSENGELVFRNVPVAESSWGYAVTNTLRKHSAFLVWLFGRQLGETKISKLFAEGLNTILGDQELPELMSNYTAVDATCTLASTLTAEIRNSNARAVFVVIPDVRPDTRLIDENPEYSAIRGCLSALDAEVVDLTDVLSQGLVDDAATPIVFEHDMHWTPQGHSIVGRAVTQALAIR